MIQWAKKTTRDLNRAIRRLLLYYDFSWDENDDIKAVRQAVKNKKKKKKFMIGPRFKYGVQIPQNVREAYKLDKHNGDDKWTKAIKKEINTLVVDLKCFEFHPAGTNLGSDFQCTTLVMIFEVKHDLHHKARLVAGRHLVNLKKLIWMKLYFFMIIIIISFLC